MSCVNTNSKEFKDAVSRLDVHPDNLEAVLHKFLNMEGDRFPTDAEIMQELQGRPWTTSDDVEVLWWGRTRSGNRAITFGNLSSAMNEYQANRAIFPTGSTTMYRNSKGEYVVSIGAPILEGMPFAIDEFTIDNVLSTLDGRMYHNVLKSIINLIGKENIGMKMGQLKLENTTMAGKEDKYGNPLAVWNGSEVVVDPVNFRDYLDSRFSRKDTAGRAGEFRRVLTHELVHGFTVKILDADINTLSPEELKFRHDIYDLYNEAVAKTDRFSEFYGFEDAREFIAEALSNRDFQMHLATIKSGKGNLWTKMLDIFSRILNKLGVPSHSVLANIMSSTSEYMEYLNSPAYKEHLENQRKEAELADEVAQEEYEGMEAPPDDFFASTEPTQSIRNRFIQKANGYRDGSYEFRVEHYYNKPGEFLVLNIPTYRATAEEAVTKGKEMLEKLGFDSEDFDIGYNGVKTNRSGQQYMNVKVKGLADRRATQARRQREALEAKAERDAYEEYRLSTLSERERRLEGLSQAEKDFINRIDETNPGLADQVLDGFLTMEEADEIIRNGELTPFTSGETQWARAATNSYEVSTQGDSRFSALKAKFKPGTIIDGVDVSGMTIENVYQSVIKKSGKGKAPSADSKLYNPELKTKAEQEDFSYRGGYLPLWQEWARQNPELIQELREKSAGKVLTDKFASTRVSQARALAEILNSEEVTSDLTPETESRVLRFSGEFEGATNYLVGIVPEPLLSKVEDYIMSGGQFGLSEADAQQFLNYAETAYAEQETTNQEQQPIKKENKAYMERAVTITQQIDNLNNSTALSATEVRHVAEQAVYWISDHITEIQETPGLAEKIYGEQFKDKDFASMSRAEVVRTIGPDAMIAMCKEKFSPENTDYEDFDTIEKAEVITDNWGAIMMLASDVFLSVEDFSIVSSKDGSTSEVNEDYVADADNFNNSNMEGDVLENEGDLQEHWQVETKTLDVLATMSQMVRQALTKCYLLDKDGNNITSEFGINERVNAREATNSILRWTQGALNLEQMIAKLQEKADSNPWVRQIIDRLSDTSGKETDFQGQFFGTFCKHFQPYSVVIEENGRYKSIQVNENPALSEAMTQVTTQYKIGEHPLFTTEGINKEAFKELKSTFEELSKYNHQGYDLTNTETRDEAAKTLGYVSNLLGYYVTPEMVAENLNKDTFKRMFSALRYITNSLEKNLDNATYEPFKFGSRDGINGNTREFLKPITDHLEDIAVSAFYDSGKMYQSYITPSYTSKLFQKFGQTGKAFDDFIMAEYGNMPWFHTGTNIERGWRNAWLKALATDSKAREIFKHKVQLNFNKHNYMRNMSDMEYALSLFTEYFSENASEKQTRVPAWFRVPMLSNKPSSEFIRFYSERGANYREALTNGFKMIFDQELSRIQTVEMRNLQREDPRFIKNFDTNGKKFMFLDFMNEYLTGNKKSSELGKLIRQKLDGHQVDEARLNELAKEAIMQTMEARAESVVATWEAQGILKGAEKVANIGTTEEEIRENLKNFVWNDTFAAMNIMQLTITDLAFYKDAEDLQKRLAQIHAPGIRGNAKATDYEGKPVTDGNFRTIKLTDFDTFISNIIDNVSVVFDRRIASAPESEKAALRALKDSLVGKKGAFRQINVADAQGYSSPTSYRKKALVFGKWSRQAEEIYQKLKKGTYTYNDLKVAFQPLKPFVYSQITKDAGVEGAPLGKMKVPVQYKNSEYLLVMADAILQGENTGRPNLLRAIFEVMEESHYDEKGNYKTDGIDTAQFESTVKSGLMGRINLNDLVNDPNGESIAKARMEAAIYEATPKETTEVNPETGVEETKTIYERTGQYNSATVDAAPFEDYCLQQEVPEHFKEHEQAHGSQLRYIIVSELENFNYLGEPVTYNLEGKQVTAQEFKAEYENTIAENIQESIDELAEELSLNDPGSIKDRNIALSKILQREILSSPRYGVDLLQACSVDENGRFRIPLGDPIQSKRVEQLINSIIKNRVNKQKLPGGPVVQVTNFGTSKELNIRFKDKSGNLLMTRAEYEKHPMKKEMSQADKFNARYRRGGQTADGTMSYEDYIKENQAGIAYFEVFAPIYSNQLFTQFADKNGVINMQALEMLDPDLLKMIGYRIPTEDKYSMAPLKIVGFLPREAGDGIMLPNDITLLTGSDFDVDKEYLMRKDYGITRNKVKRGEMHRILYDELVNSQKGKLSYDTKIQLNELIDQFLDDPFDSSSLVNQKTAKGFMTMTRGAYNRMLRTYMQNMYTVNRPTEGRTYRNNKIVDMTYEVLTHETSADKMLNPGGFDPQKRMGYLVSAYKMHSDQYTWEQLQGMSITQLKDLNNSSKNLSYIDTHIQFYKQNSAAGALIGIFAVNRIAHAVLESGSADGSSTYSMNVDNVCKITRNFTVAGMEFGGYMPFDMRYDRNGQLIGKVMGSLVASAADAVKDPVLNLMNINSNTANILNTLVRFGMPFDNAALFLSQSVISDVLADFSRENITGYMSLSKVIQNKLNEIKNETGIDESSDINKEELTYEELVEGLKPNAKPEIAYKTLVAFGNFQKIAEAMRMPTFATRFNSMSSAVGPLIIDNLITEQKMQKLSLESNIVDANVNPVDMSNIFLGHPILNQFQRTVGIARQLFGNMPANSTGFRNILDLVNDSPLSSVVFGDRKLLSSLSDFYQSYLVMKNGVVNPQELGSTITEFPKEFMEKEYKKKYADNALIQAIKYGTDKSGRATLQVDITGLDTQQKEKLSSAWIDLHKVNPELSTKLFNYNFFRGGIGFSPKTFMSLVPVYVKERIPGYVDTFRILPSTVPETVLDQFIRNNWDNNRLVPRKKATFKQLPNGHVEVFRPSEVKELTGVQYFKTKVNNEDKLFMQILERDGAIEFKEIAPLGSNKEYLEMSESTIDSPLNVPAEAKVEAVKVETGKDSELAETEVSAEVEDTEVSTTDETRLNDLLHQILVIEGVRNEEQAGEYIKNYQAKSDAEKARMERQTKNFFEARFKKLGIEFNSKLIDDIYKLIC